MCQVPQTLVRKRRNVRNSKAYFCCQYADSMRPPELFAKCEADENALFAEDLREQKKKWIIDLTFGPLLPPEPEPLKVPSLAILASSSSEYTQVLASNYAFLLSSLRQARTRDRDGVWL